MSEENTFAPKGVSRRTLVKGAAWSLPVIAVAAATPLASASTANASLAWTSTDFGLLQLRVLDTATVLTAQVAITVPDEYTITNGPGAINDVATVSITVGRPAGVNLPVGRARGFGVYSVDGIVTDPSERSIDYQDLFGVEFGFPITTWTGTRAVSIASNGALAVPVEFALAGVNDLLTVGVLSSFPVNLTVTFTDGSAYNAASTITVPVNAGIL